MFNEDDVHRAFAKLTDLEALDPKLREISLESLHHSINKTIAGFESVILEEFDGNKAQQVSQLHDLVLEIAADLLGQEDYFYSQTGLYITFVAVARGASVKNAKLNFEKFCSQSDLLLASQEMATKAAYTALPEGIDESAFEAEPSQQSLEMRTYKRAERRGEHLRIDFVSHVLTAVGMLPPNSPAARAFIGDAVQAFIDLTDDMRTFNRALIGNVPRAWWPTILPGGLKILEVVYDHLLSGSDQNILSKRESLQYGHAAEITDEMLSLATNIVVNFYEVPSMVSRAERSFRACVQTLLELAPSTLDKKLSYLAAPEAGGKKKKNKTPHPGKRALYRLIDGGLQEALAGASPYRKFEFMGTVFKPDRAFLN